MGVLNSNRFGKYEITEGKYMTEIQTNDNTEEIKQRKNEKTIYRIKRNKQKRKAKCNKSGKTSGGSQNYIPNKIWAIY